MNYETIILDRDGVINELRLDYVRSVNQLTFIPGSIQAIKVLKENGKKVVIASNQAGVGKGLITLTDLSAINRAIIEAVGHNIDFYYCTHTINEACNCRKPKPGLLEAIMQKERGPYVFVGDNITDLEAAKAAGIKGILVKTGHGNQFHNSVSSDIVFADLITFVQG